MLEFLIWLPWKKVGKHIDVVKSKNHIVIKHCLKVGNRPPIFLNFSILENIYFIFANLTTYISGRKQRVIFSTERIACLISFNL